jgi:bifunctional UDP-N-acetylglucosamine pyrophosphorylase/glucosamine-1-phosphate N-acetyltransferase
MRDGCCIIMAAGLGKRMGRSVPKVLLRLAGRPLVSYAVEAAYAAGARQVVVVVGHGRQEVQDALAGYDVDIAVQEEQRGTAHAVMQALPALRERMRLVVTMSGDSPLLRAQSLKEMISYHKGAANAATVLTAEVPDPSGYGRILRDSSGNLMGIVEERDCDDSQRAIREINSSVYCFQLEPLAHSLGLVRDQNAQGEFYLTDVLGILRRGGFRVGAYPAADWREVLGVNRPEELRQVEAALETLGRRTIPGMKRIRT